MLIKRLQGQQQAGQAGQSASDNNASAPSPTPLMPENLNTEAMPGTAPLPRNTVLQGRYDVEGVLGIGGMSTVYKARDLRFTSVARYCAVKEMPDTAPDPRTGQLRLAVFEREAALLATLSHPGIPKIYDFFPSNGRVYLVMEYIDGKNLETQLELRKAAMQEDEVVKWAVQICEVLEYLHNHSPQPIIFRDMKPPNIIVAGDGKVTLIDFGIAKVFQSDKRGTMIGTEGYAPPEQYRGLAEPRGDIYALGATMHHLLTNFDPRTQTPFTFHERPIRKYNSRVSEYIESVILRATEYDIDRRWPSALAFRQALKQSSIFDAKPNRRPSDSMDDDSGSLLLNAPVPRMSSSISEHQSDPNLEMPRMSVAPSGMLVAPNPSRPNTLAPMVAPPSHHIAPAQHGGAQVLWTFTSDDEIRSSPLCEREVVFFGSYDTHLYALNGKSGDFLWKAPTKAGICSSPVLLDDLVMIGSEDNYLYAFDARRGTQSWTYRSGAAIRSSPRTYKNSVFIGSDDQYIYALHADTGQVAWKYRTWNFVRSSAAFANGLAFVGSSDGNLYALDVVNGTLRWKLHTLGAIIGTPLVVRNNVIVGSMDNYIYAVDVDTGYTSWRYESQRSVSSSPAMAGERVIFGSSDGFVYCLDSQNGRVIWNFDTSSQVTSSPRVSLANDAVYFGAGNNFVYSLDISTGEERWKYKTRGPVVSSPFVDDGIVYIGSLDRKLYALAV
ncbi:MAG: serine/threonine-protein kinase [Chloroflexia bacterium]